MQETKQIEDENKRLREEGAKRILELQDNMKKAALNAVTAWMMPFLKIGIVMMNAELIFPISFVLPRWSRRICGAV